jgi:7-alpha-hydroxysteroid dehydrogenase
MSHRDRGYVVSAAAGGIGTELVGQLLADGASVVACDISGRRLEALAGKMASIDSANASRLFTIKTDVAEESGVAQVVELAARKLPALHGIANIAGGIAGIGENLIDRPLAEITLDEFRQTCRLNLETTFLMSRAFAAVLAPRGYGKIVNVASLAAFGNFDHMGNAAYDAAKAGVVGLTQTLARSLGPSGIRVNVVAPGSVFTERVRQAFSPEFIEAQRQRIPLHVLTGPQDVAAVLAFLLSPQSDQVTGEVIRVSGGLR